MTHQFKSLDKPNQLDFIQHVAVCLRGMRIKINDKVYLLLTNYDKAIFSLW